MITMRWDVENGAPSSGRNPILWVAKLLILIGVVVAVAGWMTRHRPAEAAPEPPRAAPAADWNGTWQQDGGDAIIRLRGVRGEFSPDGRAIIPFVARVRGNDLSFQARVAGRPMTLRLSRDGEAARLVGVNEYEPSRVPVVFAPGGRSDRDKDAARQRDETRRLLTPADMGTFTRAR